MYLGGNCRWVLLGSRWIGPCGAQVEKGREGIKNGEIQKKKMC